MIEKEKLFNDNINIAYKIAYQYKKNYNNEFEDIVQIALLGLWKAISYYNGKYALSTYAYKVINNDICQYLRHLKKHDFNKEISLNFITYSSDYIGQRDLILQDLLSDNNKSVEDIEALLELDELRTYEKEILSNIPDRHVRVWNYLKCGYTQENIANIENISQAQVCRIRAKLLKKLKDKYDGGENNG